MKNNIDTFLRENRSIFSYLRDDNGNKIGVIIALPGEGDRKEPRIGYAFFTEVVDCEDYKTQFEKISYLYEAPAFLRKIENITNIYSDRLKYLKFPGNCEVYRYKPACIKRNETLYLARRRANYNASLFYITSDKSDPQSNSILYEDGASNSHHIIGKRINSKIKNNIMTMPGIVLSSKESFINCIRHQIRAFEYRALKYYKYIPGYKH